MFSSRLATLIEAMRPTQWTKNGLIFMALIFSGRLLDTESVLKSLAAFVLFSLVSGVTYIINDINDAAKDKLHPIKSKRPIASGRLMSQSAVTYAVIMAVISLGGSYALGIKFGIIASAYFLLSLFYTLVLKNIAIVDILVVASGFVIRAVAGALAIGVVISSWLLLCTFLLALFVILGKRRHEILLLGDNKTGHREVLYEYNTGFLDQMISVTTASTLVSYALYAISHETAEKFHTGNMIFTVPFVLYGIFRYLYIIYRKEGGGRPEKDILTDAPTLINLILWGAVSTAIIYLSR